MIKFLKNLYISYRFIFNNLSSKFKLYLAIILFFTLLAAVFDLSVIYNIGMLFSQESSQISFLNTFYLNKFNIAFLIIITTYLAALLRIFSSRSLLYIGDKIYVDFSINLYSKIIEKDIEFVDKVNIERLTSLVFNNASRIPESLYFLLNIISSSLLVCLILSFSVIFSNSYLLFYIFGFFVLIYFLSTTLASVKTKHLGLSVTKSFSDISKLFKNIILSSRYLKTTYRNIKFFNEMLSFQLLKKRKSQSSELFYSALPRNIAEPTIFSGIAIFYLFIRNQGNISISEISIIVFSSLKMLPQLQNISNYLPVLNSSSYQLLDLYEIYKLLDFGKYQRKTFQKIQNNKLYKIVLQNVQYKIPKFNFFKDDLIEDDRDFDFNLNIKNLSFYSGMSYLFLSKSGSGKSIFLDLLVGLRTINNGKILYLDENNKLINKPKIRYVYQKEQIIGRNIISYLLGRNISNKMEVSTIEINKLEDLRKKLGINFFTDFRISDKQYFNNLLSNDMQYSGGQKQRIILWSALMEKSDLLILDEALGALDKESSLKIVKYIKEIYKKKILLIVSHDTYFIHNKIFDYNIRILDGVVEAYE